MTDWTEKLYKVGIGIELGYLNGLNVVYVLQLYGTASCTGADYHVPLVHDSAV